MKEFQAVGTKVLVKCDDTLEKTPGGIALPQSARDKKTDRGLVVSIGSEVQDEELDENDVVVFQRFAGADVEINGEKYLVLDEKDLLVIIHRGK